MPFPPITPWPLAVTPDDQRPEFSAKMYARIAAEAQNVEELNALGEYIDQAVADVDADRVAAQEAVGSAALQVELATEQAQIAAFVNNYVGDWASLEDAYAKHVTVKHGGLFWLLVNDLADIALSEPGMTADWTQVPGVVEVATPNNLVPAAAATDVGGTTAIVLQANSFGSVYPADTHTHSQWQVHTALAFAFPLYDSGAVAGAISHTLPAGTLAVSTSHYWRVRYRSSRGTWSAWSRATQFTTAAAFNQYVPVPAATPAAFGDAFEGGYYCGMTWNELAQSATSKALATGAQTFTLGASMYTTPLVYSGQQVEVRSRANPDNRFVGTVTGANGTALTVNVTSINGSGTFADWSIMVRYRNILAPKSSGETSSIAWKNANTAGPAGAFTLSEGWRATLAMVAAGDATTYPAAWWARGLSIGGYSDWYLPARDELEQTYRNLKPISSSNALAARANAPTSSYQNLGSWSDATTAAGTNRHSAPAGAAYTGAVPGQTAVAAFMSGGAEALPGGGGSSIYLWSSTDYNTSSAWAIDYAGAASLGTQLPISKNSTTTNHRARAMRRSMI